MIASLAHGLWDVRWLSVSILLSSMLVAAVSSVTGFMCEVWGGTTSTEDSSSCPAWLAKDEDSGWPAFGFVIWASVTGVAAWRQLGCLREWEEGNFWRGELEHMMYTAEPPMVDPYLPYHGDDGEAAMYRTRFPAGVEPPHGGTLRADGHYVGMQPPPQQVGDRLRRRLDNWWESVTGGDRGMGNGNHRTIAPGRPGKHDLQS